MSQYSQVSPQPYRQASLRAFREGPGWEELHGKGGKNLKTIMYIWIYVWYTSYIYIYMYIISHIYIVYTSRNKYLLGMDHHLYTSSNTFSRGSLLRLEPHALKIDCPQISANVSTTQWWLAFASICQHPSMQYPIFCGCSTNMWFSTCFLKTREPMIMNEGLHTN